MDASLDTLLYGMQFRRLLEKELQPLEQQYGLYRIDMHILLYLDYAGENNTSKNIMELNMFTRGHISQALSRLQKKGFVRMEQDLEDRRCTHNYLTEDARDAIASIKESYRKIYRIVMDGITQEEQVLLAKIAVKVNQNINNAL